MTPLVVAVAVAAGSAIVLAPRWSALRAVPGGAAFAACSALGTGLATALAAGLLPNRPDAVALVALQFVALDLAGLAIVAARVPRRPAQGGVRRAGSGGGCGRPWSGRPGHVAATPERDGEGDAA